jgi:O-6-methylguanine DNA methyltransferase
LTQSRRDLSDLLRLRARCEDGRLCRQVERGCAAGLDLFGDRELLTGLGDWTAIEARNAVALEATTMIPYGARRSYSDLDVPLTKRKLGWIMGANPIPIVTPCHRVTRGVEIPTGYVGGSKRRRWLEVHEGQRCANDSP